MKVPFFVPDISEPEIEAVAATIRSSWLTSGPKMAESQSAFADAVAKLKASGLEDAIRDTLAARRPYLGLCLGMHCAVIEYARNVCGLEDAHSDKGVPGQECFHAMSLGRIPSAH